METRGPCPSWERPWGTWKQRRPTVHDHQLLAGVAPGMGVSSCIQQRNQGEGTPLRRNVHAWDCCTLLWAPRLAHLGSFPSCSPADSESHGNRDYVPGPTPSRTRGREAWPSVRAAETFPRDLLTTTSSHQGRNPSWCSFLAQQLPPGRIRVCLGSFAMRHLRFARYPFLRVSSPLKIPEGTDALLGKGGKDF